MLCTTAFLTQQQWLDADEVVEKTTQDPCHIYMICRRPRITLDPDSIKYKGKTVKGRFLVHKAGAKIKIPFISKMPKPYPNFSLGSEYPHTGVWTLNEKQERLQGWGAGHFMSLIGKELKDPRQLKHLDLEVLYVGQAYGKDGSRTALDRLKTYETLLAVYAKASATAPNDEIWIVLLSFQPPIKLMIFDGRSQELGTTDKENWKHYEKMVNTEISENQRICFAEAALIRYFQPKYNNTFKYKFPNPAHKAYSECYDLDLNAVAVELQLLGIRARVYSDTVKPSFFHLARFPLHNAAQRRTMFDFGMPFPKPKKKKKKR